MHGIHDTHTIYSVTIEADLLKKIMRNVTCMVYMMHTQYTVVFIQKLVNMAVIFKFEMINETNCSM